MERSRAVIGTTVDAEDPLQNPWTPRRLRLGNAARRPQALTPKLQEIAERYGTSNIAVFGSVARDEATDTSDVDRSG
ncbi:nucleotidyltransferase family protein [Vulcanococcus sp.]|uniref:nucleotidyltransferase family protein n=1 Tax=Vulcanococcus sp. TaxID=2856995 RepID=UPI003F698241